MGFPTIGYLCSEPAYYLWELVFLFRHFGFCLCLTVFRRNAHAQAVYQPSLTPMSSEQMGRCPVPNDADPLLGCLQGVAVLIVAIVTVLQFMKWHASLPSICAEDFHPIAAGC